VLAVFCYDSVQPIIVHLWKTSCVTKKLVRS